MKVVYQLVKVNIQLSSKYITTVTVGKSLKTLAQRLKTKVF